jgi:hypothetical protein
VLTILTVLGVAAIFPAIKTFGSLEEAAARKDAENTTSCEPVAT